MNNRCTVCNHSQAHDVNLALLAGATLDHLKQQYGLSRSALQRHKRHLQTTIDRAEERLRDNVRLGYLFQLHDCNTAAAATVAASQAEGNHRLALQAVNARARIINAMAKFEVDLDRETVYRFITSPDYVQAGCLLPPDPQILNGPRQTLARSLAAACPETDPGPLFDPEDVAAYLKLAQDPASDIALPHPRQLEFPGFLVPLDDVRPAAIGSDPSSLIPDPCPSEPELKRDASGTEAAPTPPLPEINEEFQGHMSVGKISGTDLAAGPEAPPALADASLSPEAAILAASSASSVPPEEDGAAPETLSEAQATELAEYLANFAPYADPAPAPDPLPPDLAPEPAAPKPPAPRRSGLRPEPPNFGNLNVFKQLQGTYF